MDDEGITGLSMGAIIDDGDTWWEHVKGCLGAGGCYEMFIQPPRYHESFAETGGFPATFLALFEWYLDNTPGNEFTVQCLFLDFLRMKIRLAEDTSTKALLGFTLMNLLGDIEHDAVASRLSNLGLGNMGERVQVLPNGVIVMGINSDEIQDMLVNDAMGEEKGSYGELVEMFKELGYAPGELIPNPFKNDGENDEDKEGFSFNDE